MAKITREEALAILMAEDPSRRHSVEMYTMKDMRKLALKGLDKLWAAVHDG